MVVYVGEVLWPGREKEKEKRSPEWGFFLAGLSFPNWQDGQESPLGAF